MRSGARRCGGLFQEFIVDAAAFVVENRALDFGDAG